MPRDVQSLSVTSNDDVMSLSVKRNNAITAAWEREANATSELVAHDEWEIEQIEKEQSVLKLLERVIIGVFFLLQCSLQWLFLFPRPAYGEPSVFSMINF